MCYLVVPPCSDESTIKGHETAQSCNANHITNQFQDTGIIHTPCYIKKEKTGT